MKYQGVLKKMLTENAEEIQYYLDMKTDFININQLLNKEIAINFETYECLNCGLEKEIYRQGFCKSCFFEMPSTAEWIMKPELSKAHLGIEERDLEYEKQVQLKPHILYLAFSSSLKVGVTRKTQVPFRWIDQGAVKAIQIIELPNRYLAGISEVELKKHYADKTNWREMLKIGSTNMDLQEERLKCLNLVPNEIVSHINNNEFSTLNINYPVISNPLKPKSLNIVKEEKFEGELVGIKGQYLIFKDDTVFNIRTNEGLVLDLNIT